MPKKLNYKKHKKDKERDEHKRKKRKRQEYVPPVLNEEGWTPSDQAYKQDQDEWRERLFDAMMQDEGQDAYFSNYNNYTPSYTSNEMTDEEYRQYIVNGMYRKRHAAEIAAEEEWKAEKEKRRKEKAEARRKVREEEAERERVREAYRKKEKAKRSKVAQEDYEIKWQQLDEAKVIKSEDIPWPIVNCDFSLDSVRSFMTKGTSEEIKKNVRREQRKYHPDKFMTRVMSRFEGTADEKERVLSRMNEISGWLNELWASV
ncbi:hypothetical protein G6F16_002437 [Rhizopus arrhizus]|uniref:Uncharacterized protein n=1 Tax=Rhizopus oryzae TaxID=64495 RepID=A0A9P6XJ04_RHIOR|nr:hypothetical protein G6F23_008318 [Rhizopus arrhizus]KAG0767100.1 hypothetical protein G6F24_003067 [Rhizopus arrhizus]KAG0797650.1 hypothetical protein G6F21_000369 [Rhizopus arrhizus]KAG0799503.1 hypothetical protein G6F22_003161 [Rhizopus arrhizus]KAG0814932.1 hypothetical protein G6F20_004380 [Rhizopus arrhizus]